MAFTCSSMDSPSLKIEGKKLVMHLQFVCTQFLLFPQSLTNPVHQETKWCTIEAKGWRLQWESTSNFSQDGTVTANLLQQGDWEMCTVLYNHWLYNTVRCLLGSGLVKLQTG